MPVVTSVAAVGAATIGAVASSRAAGKQADAIKHGTDQSVAEQRRQFDIAQEMRKPWVESGTRALGALEKIYGIAPDEQAHPQQTAATPQKTQQQPVGFAPGPRFGMSRRRTP